LIVSPFSIHLIIRNSFISKPFLLFPVFFSPSVFVPHHSASHCVPRSQTEGPFPTAGNQKTRSIGLWKRRRLGSPCLPPPASKSVSWQSAGGQRNWVEEEGTPRPPGKHRGQIRRGHHRKSTPVPPGLRTGGRLVWTLGRRGPSHRFSASRM
jgi:hypothetical protein